MKFLKVSAYYADFVHFASRQTENLHSQPYEKQMEYLFSFSFGWANFWKKHLEENGRASVTEIIYNIDFLQKKWAEENNARYNSNNWQIDILEQQIEFYRPEIIFFEDYVKRPIEYKKKYPFIKLIISWDGLAHKNLQRYEGADVIASCHQGTVDFYNSQNKKSHLFLFGFESSILNKLQNRSSLFDLSFVGSMNISKNGHRQRLHLLNEITKECKIDYWISGAAQVEAFSINALKYLIKGMAPDILLLNKILKGNNGQAFGISMYQILHDSKITLNSHIDAAGEYAANVRLFEASGTGACLLTDWKKNMPELFDIETEVLVYRSKGECVEKIKWLLNNEDKRKKIAAAGQKKTLEKYALKNRILNFFDSLN